MAKIPGCDELLTIGHMNNMRLDIQLDMVDIEGGDSSVALDTLLRKKMIDITAEAAHFDLNMVRLVLGSKLKEGVTGATYEMVTETVSVEEISGKLQLTLTKDAMTSPVAQAFKGSLGGAAVTIVQDASNRKLFTVSSGAVAADQVVVVYAAAVTSNRIDPDGYVWVLDEKHSVKNGKITLGFGRTLFDEGGVNGKKKHISVRMMKENKLLKQIATGTPTEYEYVVDAVTGDVTFNSAMEDVDIYTNYKRHEVVDVLVIATKDFPLTVSVVHDGQFEQKDGAIQGFQIELYSCRVKSNFTLDATRQQSSTHSVTLTVIDPERVDGKLGTIKRYEQSNANLSDVC
jgi:hypothetical protein